MRKNKSGVKGRESEGEGRKGEVKKRGRLERKGRGAKNILAT
jgi:hypothetical protein